MPLNAHSAIVKPDAVAKNAIGAIIAAIEHAGLRVIGLRYLRMSQVQAEGFYAVHRQRPFFRDLVAFMTSGPSVVMASGGRQRHPSLARADGPTDATKAPAGTIRASFGTNIERKRRTRQRRPDTARFELSWFFAGADLGLPEQAKIDTWAAPCDARRPSCHSGRRCADPWLYFRRWISDRSPSRSCGSAWRARVNPGFAPSRSSVGCTALGRAAWAAYAH